MHEALFDKKQAKKKAVIYLRVSTEEQVDNYSLETQENICRKEAERRELEVVQIFRDEGRSAKTIAGRDALIEMLEFCRRYKKEIGAAIVYRLDRISRQTADYLAIRKKLAECDVTLISATEPTGNSPTEKFIETMLAGFAQMDNDVRSERSKNGMRARFMSGLSNGFVPLGYSSENGYPIKDPEKFDKVRKGWDLMLTGTKSLRELSVILAEDGLTGKRLGGKNCPLRPQTLNKIFRNKFYAGKIISKKYGMEVQGQHPPMVTEEQFYKVQAILDGRNVNLASPLAKRNVDNPDFPLRRLVKCSKCGSSLTGGWCKGHSKKYAFYFCSHRCKGMNTKSATLDTAVIEKLDSVKLTANTSGLFNAWLRRKYYERLSTLQKRRESADMELKKLYEFRQALIEKNIAGIYSDDVFKEQNDKVEGKIKTLQVTKNDDLIQKYNLEAITKFVQSKLGNITQTYLDSSLTEKRTLISSIYPSGLVWGGTRLLNCPMSPFFASILDLQGETVNFGTPGRSRTCNLSLRTGLLYPLSYWGA